MGRTREILEWVMETARDFHRRNFEISRPLQLKLNFKQRFVRFINGILERALGFHITKWNYLRDLEYLRFPEVDFETVYHVFQDPDKFDFLFENLADDKSREVLELFIKSRLLSVFIGVGNAKRILKYEESNRSDVDRNCVPKHLKRIPYYSRYEFFNTFCLKQYHPGFLKINESEMIIDSGAFVGDTAIYFSQYLHGGKVFAFEPHPRNYKYMVKNLEYLGLRDEKVIPIRKGLGSKRGNYRIIDRGGSSKISGDGDMIIEITTVDGFVEEEGLEYVSYIKADIEGYEMELLKGAQKTIERFHPKLAICVYHIDNDPVEIGRFMLERGYEIYLRNAAFDTEYVMFGIPRN